MSDITSIYQKDLLRSRRARLYFKLAVLFTVVVLVPAFASVIAVASALGSVLAIIIMGALVLASLGLLLLSPGVRNFFGSAAGFGETMTGVADSIVKIYVYIMPFAATLAFVFGALTLFMGIRAGKRDGGTASIVKGSVILAISLAGLIAYIVMATGGAA